MSGGWKHITTLRYDNRATVTTLTPDTRNGYTLEINWSEMFDQPVLSNGMITVRQPLLDGTTNYRHTMINARDLVFFDFTEERK